MLSSRVFIVHFRQQLPFFCSGFHRPLWAVYGEYRYLPPGRYVHNLEVSALSVDCNAFLKILSLCFSYLK